MSKWPRVPLASAIQHRKEFIQSDDPAGSKRCRVQLHAQGIVLRDTVPQAFFNLPLIVADDAAHSTVEPRYYVLGQTDAGRRLFIAFTVRTCRIRVISARDMSPKERRPPFGLHATPWRMSTTSRDAVCYSHA